MSHLFFGKAVKEQDLYLRVVPAPHSIKWPKIQGAKMKDMTQRGLHINPFLQESDFELFDIHTLPKRDKRKTTQHFKPLPQSHGPQDEGFVSGDI